MQRRRESTRLSRTTKLLAFGAIVPVSLLFGVVGGLHGAEATVGASTALTTSVSPLPRGAQVDGPLDASKPVHVEVALKVPNMAALQAFATAVSTPGSSEYRHYLAKGQFATQFGPSEATTNEVRSWLAASGLRVGATSSNGLLIAATATAAQIDATFHTKLWNVRLSSGTMSYADLQAPSVPTALSPFVDGILGLDDFPQTASPLARANRAGLADVASPLGTVSSRGVPAVRADTSAAALASPSPCPAASAATNINTSEPSYTQTAIAQLYGLSDLYAQGRLGYGQTIALAEQEPFTPHEIQMFERCYGLSNPVRQCWWMAAEVPRSSARRPSTLSRSPPWRRVQASSPTTGGA